MPPAVVVQAAFEVRVALPDQWRADLACGQRVEPEPGELVDLAAAAVADVDHGIEQLHAGYVDHALATTDGQCMAVVFIPQVGGDQRRRKAHHHVPAHRHQVALALPRGTDQHDRAGFEEAARLLDREILLGQRFHPGPGAGGIDAGAAGMNPESRGLTDDSITRVIEMSITDVNHDPDQRSRSRCDGGAVAAGTTECR